MDKQPLFGQRAFVRASIPCVPEPSGVSQNNMTNVQIIFDSIEKRKILLFLRD